MKKELRHRAGRVDTAALMHCRKPFTGNRRVPVAMA